MSESVDPITLVSIGDVAKKYGYHPKYFSRLAAQGKIKAWRIGPIWATTHENIRTYLDSVLLPGRPKTPARTAQARHKNSTKK